MLTAVNCYHRRCFPVLACFVTPLD